jgi:hypothetical protein
VHLLGSSLNVHAKQEKLRPSQDTVGIRAVESESEGIFGGAGVGKNVPTLTPTSI